MFGDLTAESLDRATDVLLGTGEDDFLSWLSERDLDIYDGDEPSDQDEPIRFDPDFFTGEDDG